MNRVRAGLTALVCVLVWIPRPASAAANTPAIEIQIPGLPLNMAAPRQTGWSTDFIRYDASGNRTYLTDGANKAVDVFDPDAKAMIERITVPDAPHDAIVDDAQHLLMVPLSNMNVAVIDLTNGAEQDVNVGGTSIADLAGYDAANKLLAVGSKGSNGLSFLKIAPDGNSSIANQVSLGGDSPEEPRFYSGSWYVSTNGAVIVFSGDGTTQTARWDTKGCNGHGFAMGPGSEAYLGCSSGGLILDMDTGTIVAQFDASQVGDTDQPAYDPKTNRYYAPGHVMQNGANVAVLGVIDAGTHEIVNTLNIDPGSLTQAAVDGNGVVYVAAGGAVNGACLSTCLFGYQP